MWPTVGLAARSLRSPAKVSLLLLLLCLYCYYSLYSSLATPADDHPASLVVVVCSSVPNYLAREAVRATWGREARVLGVRVVFLVGRQAGPRKIDRVATEVEEHGDIIQEDFIDTYANLTLKSLALLRWTQEAFRNGGRWQYVLKTDDDVYVNMPALWEVVRRNEDPLLLLGSVICNSEPVTDQSSKWFVRNNMFAGGVYPDYLNGPAYLMAKETVTVLLEASLGLTPFFLEDVFVTGVLAGGAGVRPTNHQGFVTSLFGNKVKVRTRNNLGPNFARLARFQRLGPGNLLDFEKKPRTNNLQVRLKHVKLSCAISLHSLEPGEMMTMRGRIEAARGENCPHRGRCESQTDPAITSCDGWILFHYCIKVHFNTLP